MDEKNPPTSSDDEAAVTRKLGGTRRTESSLRESSSGVGVMPKRRVDPAAAHLAESKSERRYRLRRLIGRGGMGEVHLARDERIGRSVALKVMRDEDAAHDRAQARFLREARVQGQLEHPAIVPVYDLDRDAEGRVFFAMKRIGGVTLDALVKQLRAGDEGFVAKYSIRKLLSAFQQVCLALDYAHARGVVHRDIKPSNLMLGDFGEVYVLDWGIAKLLGTEEPQEAVVDFEAEIDSTRNGDVLGTIGYMAPEQMVDSAGVDARADIYSLGAVLYQALTLEPLHGRGNAQERARSTQQGADARASVRMPSMDIPPELDAICVRATAVDPKDRYQSARELHDAIERFLEGDRDLRLRADLAARHVLAARRAAERVFDEATIDGVEESRKEALREAGRAIALDPESAAAAEILARLMLEPPKIIPAEVIEETEALSEHEARRGALFGAFAVLAFAVATLLILWMGVRSWAGFAAIVAPLFVAAAYAFYIALAKPKAFGLHSVLLGVPIAASIGATAGLGGAYLLTPSFAIVYAAILTTVHGLGRWRLPGVALCCLAVIFPAVAEWAGLLPSAYRFEDGAITILPQVVEFSETRLRLSLLMTNVATIVLVSLVLWRISSADTRARRRLQLHAWHLRQIAPERKRTGSRKRRAPAGTDDPVPDTTETEDTRGGARSSRSSRSTDA
jgi:eukaryotic-like serine/threonine-protein kinase